MTSDPPRDCILRLGTYLAVRQHHLLRPAFRVRAGWPLLLVRASGVVVCHHSLGGTRLQTHARLGHCAPLCHRRQSPPHDASVHAVWDVDDRCETELLWPSSCSAGGSSSFCSPFKRTARAFGSIPRRRKQTPSSWIGPFSGCTGPSYCYGAAS